MEGLSRIFSHSFFDVLRQPLKVLTQKWIGQLLAHIEEHPLIFRPCVRYERAKRLVDQIEIDESFLDQHPK